MPSYTSYFSYLGLIFINSSRNYCYSSSSLSNASLAIGILINIKLTNYLLDYYTNNY